MSRLPNPGQMDQLLGANPFVGPFWSAQFSPFTDLSCCHQLPPFGVGQQHRGEGVKGCGRLKTFVTINHSQLNQK